MSHGYADDLTIDRIDNDKGYSPDNCRWVTVVQQGWNKRNNHLITYKDKTKPLAEWAEQFHINQGRLWDRLNVLGWTVEEAFETPVGQPRKKKQ